MDIKSLWQKLDQIAESGDPTSTSEGNAFGNAIRKAKSDGIQSGEKVTVGGKEYPVKEQDMAEDMERSEHREHDKGYSDAARGINKNPYSPGSPAARAYDDGQQSYKRNFGESLSEGSMKNYLHKEAEQCESAEEFIQRFGEYFSDEQEAREFWDACCGELDENAPELKNVKHFAKPGGYGRKIDKEDPSGDKFHSSDIDDTDDEVKPTSVKRGRGRPMKGGDSDTGIVKKYDTDTLASWIIGNKPKNIGKIGKVSHVNRLKEYMEMVERKTIVESYIAEGKMNELSALIDEVISGDLDIGDIVSGKYQPSNEVEKLFYDTLKKTYHETMTDNDLDDKDSDKVVEIMYNDIHNIMDRALTTELDEQNTSTLNQSMNQSINQPAGQPNQSATAGQPNQSADQQNKELPILAQGKPVGTASTPQAVQSATPMVNDILNKKQALDKMGVSLTNLEESSDIVTESNSMTTMNEALTQILDNHPHEHKMCQEGWGMDESLYSALCDHYYKEGRIPRKIWHGPADQLRDYVEQCYLQDTQPLMGEAVGEDISADLGLEPGSFGQMDQKTQDDILTMPSPIKVDPTPSTAGTVPTTTPTTPTTPTTVSTTPSAMEEKDITRHAMSRLIDKLDKTEEYMYESKKPSAGMTKSEKSSLVKKAKSGADIGKPGKGFEKVANKAAEKYGSKEKGKKVAAAAMWKNAAPTNEGKEDDFDAAALAQGKRGRAARDNPEASVALNKKSKTSQDAAKELEKLRNTQKDLDEGIGKKIAHGIGKVVKKVAPKWVDRQVKADDEKQAAAKKSATDKFMSIAQKDTKKVNEGKFGQMDADLADLSPAEFKKEYGMTKAEAREKHGGKKPETKKIQEMDGQSRGRDLPSDDDGKKEYTGKVLKTKNAVKSAEKGLNKAFNKTAKKEKVKESVEFSTWDNQLSSLLKPAVKQPVSESVQAKKSIVNEDSTDLSTMIKFAGLTNVMEELKASIYTDDGSSKKSDVKASKIPQLAMPTGMGMSQNPEKDVESSVVEPMMNDEVIDGLTDGSKESETSDNEHLSFFKKMLSHGQSEVKTETPKAESGEQSGIPASTSQSAISGSASKLPETETKSNKKPDEDGDGVPDWADKKPGKDDNEEEKEEKLSESTDDDVEVLDEENMMAQNGDNSEEQSEVDSDAVRDAGLAQGGKDFFSSENSSAMAENQMDGVASDGIIAAILSKLSMMSAQDQAAPGEPVMVDVQSYSDEEPSQDYADEESQCDQCSSCGGPMNEGHQCSENLNEWANSSNSEGEDEQFQTDMDFMTKVISGGLNNQKQDQTTLPSTRVVTKDESKEVDNSMGGMLRKLSGIN